MEVTYSGNHSPCSHSLAFQGNPEGQECFKGWHYCKAEFTVEESDQVSAIVFRAVQEEVNGQEIKCIQKQEAIPKGSPFRNLDLFIDTHGLLRVGGHLPHSSLDQNEKNPLIIPDQHHIAALLIRKHHEEIHHQGRHYRRGYTFSWLLDSWWEEKSEHHHLPMYNLQGLRAPLSFQKMAKLSADRLSKEPPFINVGLNAFGPWSVSSCWTRGGLAQRKH